MRILTTGLAGLVTTFALSLPVGLSVIEIGPNGLGSGLIKQIFSTAAGYPYVSVNAYNPWALAQLDGNGHREGRDVDLRHGHRQPGGRRRQLPDGLRDLRVHPRGRARRGAARVRVRRRLRRRRGPARPADAPRRRDGPRGRVLHPADAGPRALPLPVLRAGGDPRGVLVALAGGVRGLRDHDVPEHVRRPDDALRTAGSPGIVDWLGIGESIRSEGWVTAIALANSPRALGVRPAPRRRLRDARGARARLEDGAARRSTPDRRAGPGPGLRRRPDAAASRRASRGWDRCAVGGLGGGHGPRDGSRAPRGRRGDGRRDAHLERAADAHRGRRRGVVRA